MTSDLNRQYGKNINRILKIDMNVDFRYQKLHLIKDNYSKSIFNEYIL